MATVNCILRIIFATTLASALISRSSTMRDQPRLTRFQGWTSIPVGLLPNTAAELEFKPMIDRGWLRIVNHHRGTGMAILM